MIHTIHLLFTLQEFKLLSNRKKNHNYSFFSRNLSTLVIRIKINPVSVKSHRYWNQSNKMAQYLHLVSFKHFNHKYRVDSNSVKMPFMVLFQIKTQN